MGPSQEKLDHLAQRMEKLGIHKQDIEEKFIKASGRGGQKVNKTSSAVFVKHIPTGIFVKCGSERSLTLNRFLALRRLTDHIESAQSDSPSRKSAALEKIRKQKKRRKKKSQKKHGFV